MGGLSNREILLAVLVVLALALWIFGGDFINATTAAARGDLADAGAERGHVGRHRQNSSAWNTLAWFATLVALADGLNRVGFVKWFADRSPGRWAACRRSSR